ncbi:MAG TPA: DinB family protein, partial [Acidimicrobiales bacterium]|nr:DinB family protein [Acidimicrobiales bacterium]
AAVPGEGPELDRRASGGWSARQVLHHLADSETQSYLRLRRLLADAPPAAIQGYDEAAWAESPALGYAERPVATSVAVVAAVRAASHELLARLVDTDLAREGEHSESGRYTLDEWLTIYTVHPRVHRAQMLEALGL